MSERLTIDGVDMKTLAQNVETLGATLRAPARRGSNAQVAGRAGSQWSPNKPHDEAEYVLPIWVLGTAHDGSVPSGSMRREFFDRVDELTALLGKGYGLLDVRHWQPDGSVRQALCEVRDVLDFTTMGANPLGKVTVSLANPGAYFQDIADVTTGAVTIASTGTMAAFARATAPLEDAVYTIKGPITNPRITDPLTGAYVQYNAALTSSQSLVIDSAAFALSGVSLTPNLGLLIMNGTSGRLMRLEANPVSRGYAAVLSGTGTTTATTLSVTGRRKYLVG